MLGSPGGPCSTPACLAYKFGSMQVHLFVLSIGLRQVSHLSSWKPRPKVTLLASSTSLGPRLGSA